MVARRLSNLAAVASCLLSFCGDQQPVLSTRTSVIVPAVLWKAGETEVSAAGVDSVTVTISSSSLSADLVKKFAYTDRAGLFPALETGITIDVRIECLDPSGVVIFRGGVSSVTLSGSVDTIRIEAQMTTPVGPSGATATALSGSRIRVDWTDASSNESGFVVERRKGTTSFAAIDTVGPNQTSYLDTGLEAATAYAYRLSAYNAAGSSTGTSTTTAVSTLSPSVNSVPSITIVVRQRLLADTVVSLGSRYVRVLSASDSDTADALTFSASPPFTVTNKDSLVWTVGAIETLGVWVKVTDGKAQDSIGWTIRVADTTTVQPTNSKPVFTSAVRTQLLADTTLKVGDTYTRVLAATDADSGDILAFSLSTPLTLKGKDTLLWSPTTAQTVNAWVKVSDGEASDSIGWRMTVVDTLDTSTVQDTGLIAWYKLDGDGKDASGNGLDGTSHGGVTGTVDRFGVANRACRFTSQGDCIVVQDHPKLDLAGDFSVGAWVKVNAGDHNPTGDGILIKRDTAAATPNCSNFELLTHPTKSLLFQTGCGPSSAVAGVPGDICDGVYHFVVGVNIGDSMRVYLDGQLGASKLRERVTHVNNCPIGIGARGPDNTTRQLKGAIDDVRIYGRALSGAEIDALYREGGLGWKLGSSDSTGPAIAITSHSFGTNDTLLLGTKILTLSGTAADTSGTKRVEVTVGASTQTFTTSTWSAQGLPFVDFWNAITIKSVDSLDNLSEKVYHYYYGRSLSSPPTPHEIAVSESTITIVWAPNQYADHYVVYRGAASSGPFDSVGTTADSTFTDGGLSANTPYYYKIQCRNLLSSTLLSSATWDMARTGGGGGLFNIDASTVALWRFDALVGDTARDITGNGYHCRVSGAASEDATFGKGLRFDGVDDRAPLVKPLPSGQAGTIEAWCMIDNVTGPNPLISHGDTTVGSNSFMVYIGHAGMLYGLAIDRRACASSPQLAWYESGPLTSATWYYVALVSDGTRHRLYLNGTDVPNAATGTKLESGEWLGDLCPGTLSTSIGYRKRLGDAIYFKGVIDEMRVSDTARSASEIQAVWTKANGG